MDSELFSVNIKYLNHLAINQYFVNFQYVILSTDRLLQSLVFRPILNELLPINPL